MATYDVRQGAAGEGGTLPTLSAAARLARAGDTVNVGAGVYRERLVLSTDGVTWKGEPGAILDGNWQVGDGPGDGQGGPPMVSISGAGVVVEGLTIRNSPGDGIAVGDGGDNSAIINCRVDHSYSGGIIVNGSKPLGGVRIVDCVITRSGMSWAAGYRRNVSGSLNLIRADSAFVVNTVVAYGYGEGINIGKGSRGCAVVGCTIFDNAHLCLYFNRCTECRAENNTLFLTGFRERLVGGDTWPAGLVFGDEVSARANTFPHSRGNKARGNVVVNCGTLLSVRNNSKADGYDTCLDADTLIEGNTFIGGPCTRAGIDIKENLQGRPHEAAVIRENVIDLRHGAAGADIATSSSRAIYWRRNAWSATPPKACQGEGDINGFRLMAADAALRNNFPQPEHNVNLDNYRPPALSPLIGAGANGRTIGALGATSAPPPPDNPPPPLPDEDEPPVLDRAALMERAAAVGVQLATLAQAGNAAREQLAIMALAHEAAADELAALLTMLDAAG